MIEDGQVMLAAIFVSYNATIMINYLFSYNDCDLMTWIQIDLADDRPWSTIKNGATITVRCYNATMN
jgi:hypothetical protein